MAGADTNPPKPSLHPVYTVTNIQNKVRTLDGTKVTYSSWVKLFKLHARGYKVLAHIDGTAPPAKTAADYEQWAEIDAIVLQWIYGTLSDDLLVRVLEPESSAFEAWEKIKHIFLNNKGSRAAALEHEFTNLTLRSMQSLDEYCQRLKDLADQLNDVDNPVNEQRLVLQLVRGLPPEYDTAAAYINQTLPGWDTARSMLQLEQNRQQAREGHSTTSPSTVTAEANIAADSQSRPQTRTPRGPSSTRQQQRGPNRRDRPNNGNQPQRPPRPTGPGYPFPTGQYATPPWWAMMPPPSKRGRNILEVKDRA